MFSNNQMCSKATCEELGCLPSLAARDRHQVTRRITLATLEIIASLKGFPCPVDASDKDHMLDEPYSHDPTADEREPSKPARCRMPTDPARLTTADLSAPIRSKMVNRAPMRSKMSAPIRT